MFRRTLLAAATLAVTLVGSADSLKAQGLGPWNNYAAGGYGNRWYGYGGMGYGNPHYYGNTVAGGLNGNGNYNGYGRPYNSYPSYSGYPMGANGGTPAQSSYAPRYPLYHSPNPGYFVPGIHYGYGPYNFSLSGGGASAGAFVGTGGPGGPGCASW